MKTNGAQVWLTQVTNSGAGLSLMDLGWVLWRGQKPMYGQRFLKMPQDQHISNGFPESLKNAMSQVF